MDSNKSDELIETPDLNDMSNDELCQLMLACSFSSDPSDRAFIKACRDELARRKPNTAKKGGLTHGH